MVGCAIRRAVGGGNNGEPEQEKSSGGGELLQISGNKGQEEIEIKGLGLNEQIQIRAEEIEQMVSAERIVTAGFGPISEGPYSVREKARDKSGNWNSWGVHGNKGYPSDSLAEIWWGQDFVLNGSNWLISPVNGVITYNGDDKGGHYVDIETSLKANDSTVLRGWIRFHHVSKQHPKNGTPFKIGQRIVELDGIKGHSHAGCLIGNPNEKGHWLVVPLTALIKPGVKPGTYPSGNYTDVCTISQAVLERNIKIFRELGIVI